jgi:hypothetical protein
MSSEVSNPIRWCFTVLNNEECDAILPVFSFSVQDLPNAKFLQLDLVDTHLGQIPYIIKPGSAGRAQHDGDEAVDQE